MVDSRETEIKEAIRRRRECISCGQRFTTYEMIEQIPIAVVKRDGATELFDAEKVLRGLTRACAKRNVPVERLQAVVADIERQLRDESAFQVPSERVGKMALERLQSVDLVAYIRFASVYRQFDGVDEFQQELARLERAGADPLPGEEPLPGIEAEIDAFTASTFIEPPQAVATGGDKGHD